MSGSKSLVSVKIQAIATDKEKWDKIKNYAALKIQEAWKSYRDEKRKMAELEAEFEERAGISSKIVQQNFVSPPIFHNFYSPNLCLNMW